MITQGVKLHAHSRALRFGIAVAKDWSIPSGILEGSEDTWKFVQLLHRSGFEYNSITYRLTVEHIAFLSNVQISSLLGRQGAGYKVRFLSCFGSTPFLFFWNATCNIQMPYFEARKGHWNRTTWHDTTWLHVSQPSDYHDGSPRCVMMVSW